MSIPRHKLGTLRKMTLQMLQRLPLRLHATIAGALVVSVALIMWLSSHNSGTQLEGRKMEFEALQRQIQEHKQTAFATTGDFTQTLPPRSKSDEVVRDMSRFATSVGAQISSLTVHPQPATDRELGRIQYNVRLGASYSTAKTWLAELLARYPTLALQELTMQALASDPLRNDVSASLVLYVRD